jgi:hypothetical protein
MSTGGSVTISNAIPVAADPDIDESDTTEAFFSPFFACGVGDAAALALLDGDGDADSLGLAGEGGSLFFVLGATPASLAARFDIRVLREIEGPPYSRFATVIGNKQIIPLLTSTELFSELGRPRQSQCPLLRFVKG